MGGFTSLSSLRQSKGGRPTVEEYLQAFKESRLECVKHYPIRNGRWWSLYLIRYGLIPKRWFDRIARFELEKGEEKADLSALIKIFYFC
jgi:hypothetical protein